MNHVFYGRERSKDLNLFKKRKYKAWLLDDDFLLLGKIVQKGFKYIFIPNNKGCGFDYQNLEKRYRRDIVL